jgi:hypothetical protein
MRLPLTLAAAAFATLVAMPAWADDDEGIGKIEIGVPNAVTPTSGVAQNSVIDPKFRARLLATGTDPLENPSGLITKFGLLADNTPTEPDQNLYVVFKQNPGGPSPGFDYGRHFLYQGHENRGNMAYVTRINLDIPRGDIHRITLLTPPNGAAGTGFNAIDGSTFNPFTNTLLFTQENGTTGGVIQITPGWPPQVNTLYQFLGRGGYEGIHPDDNGVLYIAEDVGGVRPGGLGANNIPLNAAAQPNSFIYRYVPNNPKRIEDGGKLQALQVIIAGSPVVFHAADPKGDILADTQLKLHTPGTSYPIKWVTIHTANKDDPASMSFDANAAAKTAGATPFKRPENIAWLPGSNFGTFYFTPTGDTDAPTSSVAELAARGSWGAVFRVDLRGRDGRDDDDHHGDDRRSDNHQSDDDGRISLFVLGDQVHNSFDNLAFANKHQLLVGEDRGDTLHDQLQKLDSVWAYDVQNPRRAPIRFIAQGRDALAAVAGAEDNEPTGVFVSSGRTGKEDLLGTEASLDDARGFVTQQHGENNVFEVFRRRGEGFAGGGH